MKLLLATLLLCLAAFAQGPTVMIPTPLPPNFQGYFPAPGDPITCTPGLDPIIFRTDLKIFKYCSAPNTWSSTATAAGAIWGVNITGTLASQTDLSNALALKAPLASPAFTGSATANDLNVGAFNKAASTVVILDSDAADAVGFQFNMAGSGIGTLQRLSGANAIYLYGNTFGNFVQIWNTADGSVQFGGHILYTGTAPAVTSGCGTGSPALDARATDNAGTLTLGTTPGSCVLTFASTWTTAPHCNVSFEGGTAGAYAATATTLTITATGLTGKLDYRCSN